MRQASFSTPRKPPRGVAAVLILAALVLAPSAACAAGSSAGTSDDSLVESIDIGRIMADVETLQGFGSREFHLESSRQAAAFLQDALADMGLAVERQYFEVSGTNVSNVVGTLKGVDDEAGTYLLGAHYDSENKNAYDLQSAENLSAPGADDDASGVSAVLEIARILSGSGFPGTVKFVMFGAEELGYDGSGGCKGSEHFVATEAGNGTIYTGTAVLDMIGYRTGDVNSAVMVLREPGDAFAASVVEAIRVFEIDLELEAVTAPAITYSDHSSFWEAGIPSVLIIEELDEVRRVPVNPNYHTSSDTADTLSQDQVLAVAQALLGGLLLSVDGGGPDVLLFGTALMSAATVSVALFMYVRRNAGKGHI